jgi:hypothetical protein
VSLWAAIVGGMAASASYAAQRQAMEAERATEALGDYYNTLSGIAPLGRTSDFTPAAPAPYTPGPCGGCGSRETIIHRGARKCAYCRSDR